MIQATEAHGNRNLVAVGVVGAVGIAGRFPSGCRKHDTCGVFSKALWTTPDKSSTSQILNAHSVVCTSTAICPMP